MHHSFITLCHFKFNGPCPSSGHMMYYCQIKLQTTRVRLIFDVERCAIAQNVCILKLFHFVI